MDRYEWLPTECADERYPMQLIMGLLDCGDDEIVAVPAGKIVNNGWGEIGSRRLVGAPRKGVPQRLTAAWFSYTEDQFFAGELELPRLELAQLFADGFQEPMTRKPVTWSKIIVGMGLGGWVSVWLAGSGVVREVARARLEPAELAWASVLDNPDIERTDFVRSTLRRRLSRAEIQALERHGPPASSWPQYWRRYRWNIIVEGLQVPLYMFLRYQNGECRYYDFARQPPERQDVGPKAMQITWLTRSRRKLLTKIRLDDAEVFRAFDEVGATELERSNALLRIDLGARSRVSISVESNETRIPLRRASVEVLSLADG